MYIVISNRRIGRYWSNFSDSSWSRVKKKKKCTWVSSLACTDGKRVSSEMVSDRRTETIRMTYGIEPRVVKTDGKKTTSVFFNAMLLVTALPRKKSFTIRSVCPRWHGTYLTIRRCESDPRAVYLYAQCRWHCSLLSRRRMDVNRIVRWCDDDDNSVCVCVRALSEIIEYLCPVSTDLLPAAGRWAVQSVQSQRPHDVVLHGEDVVFYFGCFSITRL